MTRTLLQQLQNFEADHVWVNEHLKALLRQYADQWIAVRNGQVVASAIELTELLAQLPDPAHTCVEFITQEPLEMVL